MSDREKQRDDERQQRRRFAVSDSDDAYKAWQSDLYSLWGRWNAEHFHGRLKPPHLGFGRTPPRSLGICLPVTDYGAPIQETLNDRLVFGTEPRCSFLLVRLGAKSAAQFARFLGSRRLHSGRVRILRNPHPRAPAVSRKHRLRFAVVNQSIENGCNRSHGIFVMRQRRWNFLLEIIANIARAHRPAGFHAPQCLPL